MSENIEDLVHALQAEVRKLRDVTVPAIASHIKSDRITLTSPDGLHTVTIKADPGGAGVFVTRHDGPGAAVFVGYDTDTASLSAWARQDPNRPTANPTASLVAGPTGHLKLADADKVVHEFHSHDFAD